MRDSVQSRMSSLTWRISVESRCCPASTTPAPGSRRGSPPSRSRSAAGRRGSPSTCRRSGTRHCCPRRPSHRRRRRRIVAVLRTGAVVLGGVGGPHVAVLVAGDGLVGVFQFEVGGGGVEEQQVDFEVEQVRDLVETPRSRVARGRRAASPSPGSRRRRWSAVSPSMCTSWLIQSAAASFDDGASARLATSANSTRSVTSTSRGRPRRRVPSGPVSRPFSTVWMPRRRHSASRVNVPPNGRDWQNVSSESALAAVRVGRIEQPGQRGDQPLDRVPVELVLTTEPVEDLRDRPAGDRVPLAVGQVQVADRAVLGLPRRRLHEHRSRAYTLELGTSSGYLA